MKRLIIAIAAVAAVGVSANAAQNGGAKELVESSIWFVEVPTWAERLVREYEYASEYAPATEAEAAKRKAWKDGMEEKWKNTISVNFNVDWPEGSRVEYLRACQRLEFKTTAEDVEKIRRLNRDALALDAERREKAEAEAVERTRKMIEAQGGLRLIDIALTVFSVPEEAYVELGLGKAPAKIDADALFDAVAKHPGTRRIGMMRTVAQSGQNVVAKSVKEYLYPTDFDLQVPYLSTSTSSSKETLSLSPVAVAEPQSFTMREVGLILDVTPKLEDYDDTLLDLEFNSLYHAGTPTWRDYGATVPFAGTTATTTYSVPMEQPFFPVCQHCVRIMTRSGKTEFFCGPEFADDTSAPGRMILFFVTATTVSR